MCIMLQTNTHTEIEVMNNSLIHLFSTSFCSIAQICAVSALLVQLLAAAIPTMPRNNNALSFLYQVRCLGGAETGKKYKIGVQRRTTHYWGTKQNPRRTSD